MEMDTHAVEDPVSVAKVEPLHGHEHPTLDVALLEHELLVADDGFEVRVEELEDEVQVRLVAKHVQELWADASSAVFPLGVTRGVTCLDYVGMAQLAEELHFADRRHVEAVLELADLDLRACGCVSVYLNPSPCRTRRRAVPF